MKYRYILFDLDGTLLPMDQDAFAKLYLGSLAKKMAPHGYDPEMLVKTIWQGTGAMVKNDGGAVNEQRFAMVFDAAFPGCWDRDKDVFDAFYRSEFSAAKAACGYTEKAKIVRELKECGVQVILATNPIFPSAATEARIGWAGLDTDDFDYITTYENSSASKPNPLYYSEICEKLGINPKEAVMIGNDADEDTAAEQIGMDVFVLTDCLLNRSGRDIEKYPHGGFDELREFLGL